MCGTLDNYLKEFSQLRTASNRKEWDKSTNYMSPNKPLLLLAVLDMIGCGSINKNFVEPSFELTDTFRRYLHLVKPAKMSSMAYPFLYLMRDGFWNLRPRSGIEINPGQPFGTVKLLNEHYYGAIFADDLFPLLKMDASRQKLSKVLIETYFSSEVQSILLEQGKVNQEAVYYSTSLLATPDVHPIIDIEEEVEVPKDAIRSLGFRKTVLQIYDHRCALCGLRVVGPDNQTAVDAVHIIPRDRNQDDYPGNGLALCRLCEWAFGEGLLAVDDEYRLMVSEVVENHSNHPGILLLLSGKSMFQPAEYRYWPTLDNFKWHRENCFINDV